MARPRAPEEERRSECFAIRLTPAERLALQEEAERLSLSPTSLARQRLLRGRVVVQEHRRLDPRQAFELGRIGVNLNQIARALNSGQNLNSAAIEAALGELRQLLAAALRPGPDAGTGEPDAGVGGFVGEVRAAGEDAPPLPEIGEACAGGETGAEIQGGEVCEPIVPEQPSPETGESADPAPTRPTAAPVPNKPPMGAPHGS